MSTDPAGIPAMTMTATGYDLLVVKLRGRHRAVMTAETASRNLLAKCGFPTSRFHPARHYAPLTGAAAWLAEEDAQVREIIRGGAR